MRRWLLSILDSRILEILIYLSVFLLNLRLYLFQTQTSSDLTTHLRYIELYFNQDFYLPHPLFHILVHAVSLLTGRSDAAVLAFMMALLSVVSLVACKVLIRHFRPGFTHPCVYVFAGLVVNLFTAIFVPAYNPNVYLGQWSPNIWHSPTMALLKPLAIFGFAGTVVCLTQTTPPLRRTAVLTSLCLLAGTLAKPSFIICFIPAVGSFLLIIHPKDLRAWKTSALLFMPSLGLLAWQFLRTYTRWAVPTYFQDHIILTSFVVTRMYAPSAFVSSLLVLAFPLSVLAASRGWVLRNPPLLLSYLLAFVGFLQASFLAEQNKVSQGAFVFGYIISLFFAYLFSFIEYLGWMQPQSQARVSLAWKASVSLIMLAHLVSGLLYWRSLVLGQIIL